MVVTKLKPRTAPSSGSNDKLDEDWHTISSLIQKPWEAERPTLLRAQDPTASVPRDASRTTWDAHLIVQFISGSILTGRITFGPFFQAE